MTIKEAVKVIAGDYDKLEHEKKGNIEAVWVVLSDKSREYEIDEEWVGVTKSGELAWAHASGCSCWEGEYGSELIKTIKSFKFGHEQMSAGWKNAVIEFAKTKKVVGL